MQVFIYEYFTGGGLGGLPQGKASSSLLNEAAAMAKAVVEDFVGLPYVRVVTTRDERMPAFHPRECSVAAVNREHGDLEAIAKFSSQSDWTLLIAPESGGALLARAQQVREAGGRLLSPDVEFIRVAADKQVTATTLAGNGVPVPCGGLWSGKGLPAGVRLPAVIKPLDGCGSHGLRLVRNTEELALMQADGGRIEEFVAGTFASVSVLCGPNRNWPLTASEQRLSDDGWFSYLGGRLPLKTSLDHRARRLAMRAIEVLTPTTGYVGVDLVLGAAADGSGDRIIEVNPRLTTSYVGLRAAARSNLAAAMLAVARGDEPVLSFRSEPVEFTAAGAILGTDTNA